MEVYIMGKVAQIVGKVNAQEYIGKNGYPIVGTFVEEKILQKFYKQLSDEQLDEWIAKENLEYKVCVDSESINRMRKCMAILYKHFPKQSKSNKKASKYADFSTEALVQMALDNDVVFEGCDDNRILRMRAIMALRAHKVIE